MSATNEWERATEAWAWFQAEYPGSKMGAVRHPSFGPLWIARHGAVIEVRHPHESKRRPEWFGRFHLREAGPEQLPLEL